MNPKHRAEIFKLRAGKCFGEDVGGVFVCWNVDNGDISILNTFTNEMITNVDVFGTRVKAGVVFRQ